MWKAISTIAERLVVEGEISGEECENIFEQLGVMCTLKLKCYYHAELEVLKSRPK